MKYEINGEKFQTQKAIIDYVRTEINYLINKTIEINDKEWSFLQELVLRHPDSSLKIGVGIKSFNVDKNYSGNGAELSITRKDNSIVDISWIKCAKMKVESTKTTLKKAMRVAVEYQIEEFKSNWKRNKFCGICGDKIEKGENMHVDHIVHFEKIVLDFLEINPAYPVFFDEEPITNRPIFKKCNNVFEEKWRQYHKEYAKLRFAHVQCNLRRNKFKSL